jgi:hypothetical protein
MKNTTQQESISPNFHPNAPESNPNKLFTKRNAKLAAFVLTLVAAGYISYNVLKSDEKTSEDANSMPPIEQQTPTINNNIVAEANQEAITQNNVSEQQEIIDKYAESMTKYKNMSVDDFERLSNSERQVYGSYLADTTNYSESFYAEDRVAGDYQIEKKELSLDSSGQDILDNHLRIAQITKLQTGIDKTKPRDEMWFFRSDDAQKILSSSYAFNTHYINGEVSSITTPSVYKKEKDSLSNREESAWMSDKNTELETSKLVSVTVGGSKDHQRKLVKYTTVDNKITYAVFEYVTYKSYDNSEKSNWILADHYKDEKEVPKYYL